MFNFNLSVKIYRSIDLWQIKSISFITALAIRDYNLTVWEPQKILCQTSR